MGSMLGVICCGLNILTSASPRLIILHPAECSHVLAPFNCCVHTASRPFDRFEVPTIVGFMSAGRRRRPWVTFAFIGGILPFMRRRNCIWARPAHCAAEKASKLCFMWSNLLRVAARPGFEWNIHAVAGQSDENGTVWWN